MSATQYGVVVTPPDAQGFGTVTFADQERRCWFKLERFAAPWPVPVAGDTVAVVPGTPQWQALWLIKRGAPTYVFTPGGA